MIEQDTIKLLRECDAGIKMGISSIEEVIDHVKCEDFRHNLSRCKQEHEALQTEITQALDRFGDEGKDPNPIAGAMSWIKTETMMAVKPGDASAADLMTDGCNMGVKSLHKYLNEYKAADEKSKDIAKKLVNLEQKLAVDIRTYL